MRGRELFEAVGLISERYIAEAAAEKRAVKNRTAVVKWLAAAACVALFAGLALPFARLLAPKAEAPQASADSIETGDVLYFDPYAYAAGNLSATAGRAMYEDVTDFPAALARFGLSAERLAESAGDLLGTGALDAGTGAPASVEVYAHKEYAGAAVLVMKRADGAYRLMLYCNFETTDESKSVSVDAERKLALYGVFESGDIAAIERTDADGRRVFSSLTGSKDIARFYEGYRALGGVSNAAFQSDVFGGMDEGEQQKLGAALADSCVTLRVRLQNGLCFYIGYYPEIGYLYQSLDYYRPDGALRAFIGEALL